MQPCWGVANSKVLKIHGQRMIDADYRPGFKADLRRKDLRIVLETAQALGIALPGTALVSQYLKRPRGPQPRRLGLLCFVPRAGSHRRPGAGCELRSE